MRLTSVETLLRLVFTKLFVRELIRSLVLSPLLTSIFMGLKPRIGCCKAFSITKKSICNRCDSSSPWPVSSKVRSTQPTNGISTWFPHWTLSLSHGSKISSILETLCLFKWVFNQASWLTPVLPHQEEGVKKTFFSNQLDYLVPFWWYQSCVVDACLMYFPFPFSN